MLVACRQRHEFQPQDRPARCPLTVWVGDRQLWTLFAILCMQASGLHALRVAFSGAFWAQRPSTTSCLNQGWHPCDLASSLYTVEHLAVLGQDHQAPISRKVGLRSALRPGPLGYRSSNRTARGRNMARGVRKPPAVQTPASKTATPPKPLNLTDGQSLKRALDEAAAKALTSLGLEETFFVSNVKLGLGLTTCLVALVAQFPQYLSLLSKFPDNWWLLASCVATYGVLTLALNTFTSYHEGNAFVFLHVAEAIGGCHDVRASSSLPRHSLQYSLTIETAAPPKSRVAASQAYEITRFFTEDGYLADDAWSVEVKQLWQQLHQSSSKAS